MNKDPLGKKIEAFQELVESEGNLDEISNKFDELFPLLEEHVKKQEIPDMDKRIAFAFTLSQLEGLNHLMSRTLREECDFDSLDLDRDQKDSLLYLVSRLPEIEKELRERLDAEAANK